MKSKQKAIIMMLYSEILFKDFTSLYKEKVRLALDVCWQWLNGEDITGKTIYQLLDDGTDFGGLYIFMQMDSESSNEMKWDNFSYAVSYVTFLAYNRENSHYLPATIENVDDTIYEIFFDNLSQIAPYLNHYQPEILLFSDDKERVSKEEAFEFLRDLEEK